MKRIFLSVMVLVVCASFQAQAMKGLLEKRAYYVTKAKSGELVFWVIFLGGYDCSLIRKYPGEDSLPIKATVNYSMLSSGYIEGNGYSNKGKIASTAKLAIKDASGMRDVPMDSVDAIYDYGRKIRLSDGTEGEVLLDIEGSMSPAKKALLRGYKFTERDGEKSLKEDPTLSDVPLYGFAFTKEAYERLKKSMPQ